jgi:hypothetical protein
MDGRSLESAVFVPPQSDYAPLQLYVKTKLDEDSKESTASAQPK